MLHGRLDDIAAWAPDADPALIGAGCEIRVLPAARHNLLLDQAREQALLSIAGWLNQHEHRLAGDHVD